MVVVLAFAVFVVRPQPGSAVDAVVNACYGIGSWREAWRSLWSVGGDEVEVTLELMKRVEVCGNVVRLVYRLPTRVSKLGIVTGQQMKLAAVVDGERLEMFCAPVGCDEDNVGKIDLLIDTQSHLMAKYLSTLKYGDCSVAFSASFGRVEYFGQGRFRFDRKIDFEAKKVALVVEGVSGLSGVMGLIRKVLSKAEDTLEITLICVGDIALQGKLIQFMECHSNFKVNFINDVRGNVLKTNLPPAALNTVLLVSAKDFVQQTVLLHADVLGYPKSHVYTMI